MEEQSLHDEGQIIGLNGYLEKPTEDRIMSPIYVEGNKNKLLLSSKRPNNSKPLLPQRPPQPQPQRPPPQRPPQPPRAL